MTIPLKLFKFPLLKKHEFCSGREAMASGQVEGDRGEKGAWDPEAMGAMATSPGRSTMPRQPTMQQALAVALPRLRHEVLQSSCGRAAAGWSASVLPMLRPNLRLHAEAPRLL
jgi:hypothetical protein